MSKFLTALKKYETLIHSYAVAFILFILIFGAFPKYLVVMYYVYGMYASFRIGNKYKPLE